MDIVYWTEAVLYILSKRVMKCTNNASTNTLPNNAIILTLWYRGQVLAQCKLRGFNPRHMQLMISSVIDTRTTILVSKVLSIIHSFLLDHICDCRILCDLPGLQYTFPLHIATKIRNTVSFYYVLN